MNSAFIQSTHNECWNSAKVANNDQTKAIYFIHIKNKKFIKNKREKGKSRRNADGQCQTNIGELV